MRCTICGKSAPAGALLCPPCRAALKRAGHLTVQDLPHYLAPVRRPAGKGHRASAAQRPAPGARAPAACDRAEHGPPRAHRRGGARGARRRGLSRPGAHRARARPGDGSEAGRTGAVIAGRGCAHGAHDAFRCVARARRSGTRGAGAAGRDDHRTGPPGHAAGAAAHEAGCAARRSGRAGDPHCPSPKASRRSPSRRPRPCPARLRRRPTAGSR